MKKYNLPALYVIASLIASLPGGAYAADLPFPQAEQAAAPAGPIANCFATTVTPRLEQEYRYDQSWQQFGNGAQISNFFGARDRSLSPRQPMRFSSLFRLFWSAPLSSSRRDSAIGLSSTIKQRLVSANEENGNYIVSAFLGVRAPTGIPAFTNKSWIVTPILAAGKGWGDFDIQGTIGVPIPASHEHAIGTSIVSNITFQYHFAQYF